MIKPLLSDRVLDLMLAIMHHIFVLILFAVLFAE